MALTVTGLFDSSREAEDAAHALQASGVERSAIRILPPEPVAGGEDDRRRGRTFVAVRVSEAEAASVRAVLRDERAVDLAERRASLRDGFGPPGEGGPAFSPEPALARPPR